MKIGLFNKLWKTILSYCRPGARLAGTGAIAPRGLAHHSKTDRLEAPNAAWMPPIGPACGR